MKKLIKLFSLLLIMSAPIAFSLKGSENPEIEEINQQIKQRFSEYAEKRVDNFLEKYEELNQIKNYYKLYKSIIIKLEILHNNPESEKAQERLYEILKKNKKFISYIKKVLRQEIILKDVIQLSLEEQKRYLRGLLLKVNSDDRIY